MLGVGHEPELEPAQFEIELLLEVRTSCTVAGCIWVIYSGYRDECDFRQCCDIVHMISGKWARYTHRGSTTVSRLFTDRIVPWHRGIMGTFMIRIIHNALEEKDRVSFLV